MGPAVSIVIPVYNRIDHTRRCLKAMLEKNQDKTSREIILVDNGSSDGTSEYLRNLSGKVRVLSNSGNLGFAKACNQGAKAAEGKYLVFLNNDTLPCPGWVDHLVLGVERDGADVCGSKLLYPDGRVQHAGIAFDERGLGYHVFKWVPPDIPAVNKRRFMQAVSAACMLVKRSVFLDLEGFDEGYRNGLEDVDFCLRAGAAGRKILYVPESTLIHFEEASPGRKDHEDDNLRRYLSRWRGRVRSDDMELWEAEGFREKTGPDGRTFMASDAQRTGDPGSPGASAVFVEQGRAHKKAKRYAEALEEFESARKMGNNSVLSDMGDCKASLGELEQAEELYREALRVDPSDGRAMVGLGVLALVGGDPAGAASLFAGALERNGRDAQALCGLGMVRRMEGDAGGSLECFKRALAADPLNLPAIHELLRAAHELGRLEEAEECLKGYLMHLPSDPNILFTLAGVYCKEGKYVEALDALERLAVFSPEYEGAGDLKGLAEEGGFELRGRRR